MNIIQALKSAFEGTPPPLPLVSNATETPLSQIGAGSDLYEIFTGGLSDTGIVVTEKTVMNVSAVYSCVNLIGGAIASMPLPIYERTKDGRERIDHDVWWLLNEQPHPTLCAAVFWEYLLASLLLNGDAYAKINRVSQYSPKVESFEPIHKSRVQTIRRDDRLWYKISSFDFKSTEIVAQEDMLHIPGAGFDGLTGRSQIHNALKSAAGIAIAADQYSSAFFKNGAKPDFAIEIPGNPTEEQQKMMRDTWSERHEGVTNRHRPALLAGGVKLHELTMNAEDAQLIATRQFQIEDIARIFGVPPHMIGHTQNNTSWGTGVEQMSIGFIKYTLQRHLVKFEQELNRKLWPTRTKYFAEFSTAGLERGDYKSRNEGYRIALGRAGEDAWMTTNEVRKMENLPPQPDGDKLSKGNRNESNPASDTNADD
jgi:HK97 family phage portal protein